MLAARRAVRQRLAKSGSARERTVRIGFFALGPALANHELVVLLLVLALREISRANAIAVSAKLLGWK